MTTALLLIDIQNDYFPGGKMELTGMVEAARQAQGILAQFRRKAAPLYHVQHISIKPGSTFFLPDTAGVQINELVAPLESERVIQKHYPNSFRDTSLLKELHAKGIKKLIIMGAMSHMCIDATTRAAFDYGFECTVVADACATRDLTYGDLKVAAKYVHAGFMSALNGVYAQLKFAKDFEFN